MVLMVGLVFAGGLAYSRMKVDIFPALNLPVIYVCQPYGGMDPQQMEGLIANYYEYHFLYINGIHHVESEERPGRVPDEAVLPSRHRHGPGDGGDGGLRQPLAGVHAAGHRAAVHHALRHRQRAGRLPRAVERDEDRSAQIQDQALFKVRPMFAAIAGVSAPPPFGGNQRTVVVRADPDRLRAYDLSADDVVQALCERATPSARRATSASQERMPLVPTNAMVVKPAELGNIEVKPGVFLRDVVRRDPVTDKPLIEDASDIPTGYALVNGKRAVYILVTKRAERVDARRGQQRAGRTCRRCRPCCPTTSRSSFEFDQSPYVTNSMKGVAFEGPARGRARRADGAAVPARLAERHRRRAQHPAGARRARSSRSGSAGQTINLMTLGGLALAVGILVDEATVEVENIHTQMRRTRLRCRWRCGAATARRPCRGCWRCSASWPCSSRRSSCKARPERCSCRCRWRSASR